MDSHYYTFRRDEAVEQFPELVRVVGYDQAVEELNHAMSRELRDMMLFEDETRLIAMVAIEGYWRWVNAEPEIPPNIILGEE